MEDGFLATDLQTSQLVMQRFVILAIEPTDHPPSLVIKSSYMMRTQTPY